MSERDVTNLEQDGGLNDTIVKVVDWLAVVENPEHSDGESVRFGYYDAPQHGPVRHGGIYAGVHRTYTGNGDDDYHEWHQIALLYPADYQYENREYLMSIVIDSGNLHVGDQGDTAYAKESAAQFMDWLASAELTLSARADPRDY